MGLEARTKLEAKKRKVHQQIYQERIKLVKGYAEIAQQQQQQQQQVPVQQQMLPPTRPTPSPSSQAKPLSPTKDEMI